MPVLSTFLADVTEPADGFLSPRRVSAALRMPLAELSRVTRLHRNTLTRRPESDLVQERLGQVARIIAVAESLTGSAGRALVWFRHQPLIGFDNKTAAELITEGSAEAVLAHLDMLADGMHG